MPPLMDEKKMNIDEHVRKFLAIYKEVKGLPNLSSAIELLIQEAGYDIDLTHVSLKGPPPKRNEK